MALSAQIKVRVTVEMKAELARIAEERAAQQHDATNISDIAREAIVDFLRRRKKPPEIHSLRVAEEPPED